MLYFIKDPMFFKETIETLSTQKHKYAYLTPLFLTDDGVHTLEEKKKYTAVETNENITMEMTRKEKKQFEKSKN